MEYSYLDQNTGKATHCIPEAANMPLQGKERLWRNFKTSPPHQATKSSAAVAPDHTRPPSGRRESGADRTPFGGAVTCLLRSICSAGFALRVLCKWGEVFSSTKGESSPPHPGAHRGRGRGGDEIATALSGILPAPFPVAQRHHGKGNYLQSPLAFLETNHRATPSPVSMGPQNGDRITG